MGGDSNDVQTTRDQAVAKPHPQYRVTLERGGRKLADPSPEYTPALHALLREAHADGPEALVATLGKYRPLDMLPWLQGLSPQLREQVLQHAWAPDPKDTDPYADPGPA